MYALSGVARSGATRSGYTSPKCCIQVAGVERGWGRVTDTAGIESASLVIVDTQNEAPSTATFEARGWIPVIGSEVIIRLGSINNSEREFGGTILNLTQSNVGAAANILYNVSCIDYTWGMNKRKVSGYFTGSATTIAQTLISTYASGYTYAHIEAGMATVDGGITFTMQDLTDCLTQLTKRIGGSWYCDYDKGVHVWVTADPASVTNPVTLTAAHASLSHVVVTRDLSQVVTRVFVEGGGGAALAQVAAAETILPVTEPDWYSATGGVVKSGPQRITYTGVDAGGGGGLVGPGASPSSAPALALASGAGVESGAHNYAATLVTAAGESTPSPVAAITTGVIPTPDSAPVAGSPEAGSGPNTGNHYYAATFVNAAGETTSSPASNTITTAPVTTGEIAAPESAPTAAVPSEGAGPNDGTHYYAVTFGNAVGETTKSPDSATRTTSHTHISPPGSTIWGITTWGEPGNLAIGTYYWKVTFVVLGGGETTPNAAGGGYFSNAGTKWVTFNSIPTGPTGVVARKIYRTKQDGTGLYYLQQTINDNTTTSITDNTADAGLGAQPPASSTAIVYNNQILLSSIPVGPTGTTKRHVYRTAAGGSQLKLFTTINNNTTTTYTDNTVDASLGANIPTSNTTGTTTDYNKVTLSSIPIGNATVTSRKLYRTAVGGSQLKFLATLANNTATTYVDQVVDSSLGANIPTSNTATANQVSLSSIPIGPSGTTSRNIFRTVAGGSQLKLQSNIANNTATTLTDSTADASLGANVPTTDTSGLTQPTGQVIAGTTSIIVAGTGAFKSGGGWAVIGNGQQVVRYTGKSGTALTGVPAAGDGAIVATIAYNSTITTAPQLTGIPASGTGAILYAILKGDEVNLFVQRDDVAAQATLAGYIGGDGIQEDYIQDRRLARAECETRGDAQLALRSAPDVNLRYRSRDRNTGAGRTIVVNLAAPTSVSETLTIQRVTASNFVPAIQPNYDAEASSDLYTFEALLRQIEQK